jgi:hypothetical protein
VDQFGSQSVFDGPEATAGYFQQHLDNYRSSGSESCSYHSLNIMPMGELSALVTVTWRLHDARGGELGSWRESYCVLRENGKLLACTSIDHAK